MKNICFSCKGEMIKVVDKIWALFSGWFKNSLLLLSVLHLPRQAGKIQNNYSNSQKLIVLIFLSYRVCDVITN